MSMLTDEAVRTGWKLMLSAPRMTSSVLKSLLRPLVSETGALKRALTSDKTGEMSLKDLKKDYEVMNIKINADNIGDFKHIARKYGLPFTLMKTIDKKTGETAEAVVFGFFRVIDIDVAKRAFEEYVGLLNEREQNNQTPNNERKTLDEQIQNAYRNEEERKNHGTRGDEEHDDSERSRDNGNNEHSDSYSTHDNSNSGEFVGYRGPQGNKESQQGRRSRRERDSKHRDDLSVPRL